jgi:superfamily II RNA helicase
MGKLYTQNACLAKTKPRRGKVGIFLAVLPLYDLAKMLRVFSSVPQAKMLEILEGKIFMQNFGAIEKIKNLKPLKIAEKELSMEKAHKIYKRIGTIKNIHTGQNAVFVNSVFGKIIRHNGFDLRIIPALGKIYREAIYAYSKPVNAEHKQHTNFKGYSNYINKISLVKTQNDQKELQIYYIRLTLQDLKTKPQTGQLSQFHSAQISNVELYTEGASRVNSKIINMATWETPIDKRLAQFFAKSSEN